METTDNGNPEEQLIRKGVPSYLEAMIALRESQRTIREKCRNALKRHFDDFVSVIGRPLREDQIQDITSPDCINPKDWDGTWAMLAVSIGLQNYGTAYFGLYIWPNDQKPSINAVAGVWVTRSRTLFDKTWQTLSKGWQTPNATGQKLEKTDHEWDIMLYKEVPYASILDFEAILSEVIVAWSNLWGAVGGLQAVLSEDTSTT